MQLVLKDDKVLRLNVPVQDAQGVEVPNQSDHLHAQAEEGGELEGADSDPHLVEILSEQMHNEISVLSVASVGDHLSKA